ncbi:MAG: hypothetical protein L7U87_06265 [Chlamydiales bacterium]|nr:hypothetical protein [Chlamydiales bacterium]
MFNGELRSVLTGMFLISGTTIGGGMLALPIAAGMSGFIPSLVVMLACCIFMALTGLLILEATLWFPRGSHFITLSSSLLGENAKRLCWLVYIFLAYSSLVAYIADGGVHFTQILSYFSFEQVGQMHGCVGFTLLVGAILLAGETIIDRSNALVFVLMIFAYLFLVSLGVNEVKTELLYTSNPRLAWIGVPLFITAFSYQSMLPSLVPGFKKDPRQLKYAIVFGCLLTFAIYASWLYLIFGSIPYEGEYGLRSLYEKGVDVTEHYQMVVNNPVVAKVSRAFSLFAITTSFLGIGMGLIDFLADGLKVSKTKSSRLLLVILALVPSCIFSFSFPRVFFLALDWSGGFGDSILNGFIPVGLVWSGWYVHKKDPALGLPFGKKTLSLLLFISAAVLATGIAEQFFTMSHEG